ncbi:MAG: hypothetical protein K0Q53_1913 [Massilibacillus sp.]|jgi:hypothetical protein|nr:hypothetical protein [Massilibacillus sp.]
MKTGGGQDEKHTDKTNRSYFEHIPSINEYFRWAELLASKADYYGKSKC